MVGRSGAWFAHRWLSHELTVTGFPALALCDRAFGLLSERGTVSEEELLAHVYGGTAPHGPGSPVLWLAVIGAGLLLVVTGGIRLGRSRLRRLTT